MTPLITNELLQVQPMEGPIGLLFYLDYRYELCRRRLPVSAVDRKRFPLDCPKCGAPAYIGLSLVDCSGGCL